MRRLIIRENEKEINKVEMTFKKRKEKEREREIKQS
jgi:hypothetical protein